MRAKRVGRQLTFSVILTSLVFTLWPASAWAADEDQKKPPGLLGGVGATVDDLLTGTAGKFGLEIFRSVEEDGRPAVVSWSESTGDERTYNVDAATRLSRILGPVLGDAVHLDATAAFEAHVTSADESKDSNSLRWTIGLESVIHPGGAQKKWTAAEKRFMERFSNFDVADLGAEGRNVVLIANALYELNPSTDLAKAGGDLTATINWFHLAIGRYRALSSSPDAPIVSYRWRPYVGFEGGGTVDEGEDDDDDTGDDDADDEGGGAFGRLKGRARADVRFDFLTPRLIASGDYEYWFLTSTGDHSQHAVTVSLNYEVSDHVSVGVSYENAQRPPDFEHQRTFAVELGVKF